MIKKVFNSGEIYNGDVIEVLKTLPDESVDCVVTSPPYFQLRDYGYEGQWGIESTFNEYLDNLINMMTEVKRILKDTGTVWINLGDSYNSSANAGDKKFGNSEFNKNRPSRELTKTPKKQLQKLPSNTLLMIPQRFAIRCVDELGFALRNDIIWASTNKMPESVKNRFSKKHEHIFFFVKNKNYYFDLQSIKDNCLPLNRWGGNKLVAKGNSKWSEQTGQPIYRDRNLQAEDGLKNPGDVSDFWNIPTVPSKHKHYASFNEKLIFKPIVAGCPSEICTKCGKIVTVTPLTKSVATRPNKSSKYDDSTDEIYTRSISLKERRVQVQVGETVDRCECNEPTIPGVVLDPFAGSGTTGVAAIMCNRRYIMIDKSEEYFNLMSERLENAENERLS